MLTAGGAAAVASAQESVKPLHDATRTAHDHIEAVCVDGPTMPPTRTCPIAQTRDWADARLDPVQGTAGAAVEGVPDDSACVPDPTDASRAITCARGGGRSGVTYYKGNRNYECELQRSLVASTNNHVLGTVYNSLRMCYPFGAGMIWSETRGGDFDGGTDAYGDNMRDGDLIAREFTWRVRKNFCGNTQRSGDQHVRCRYHWEGS